MDMLNCQMYRRIMGGVRSKCFGRPKTGRHQNFDPRVTSNKIFPLAYLEFRFEQNFSKNVHNGDI